MKTLPRELQDDLHKWIDEHIPYDNDDEIQFAFFMSLEAVLIKHWPSETQLSKELRKLKVNNRKPKKEK